MIDAKRLKALRLAAECKRGPVLVSEDVLLELISLADRPRHPTQKQIDAGNAVCEEITDANIRRSLGGLGDCKPLSSEEFRYPDLVRMYLDGAICTVEAIYMAMEAAK